MWMEHCSQCKKETLHRYVDCQECKEKEQTCNLIICTECGEGYNSSSRMYGIIDWMTFGFAVEPEHGSVMTWETKEEAEKYAEDEMQSGLYQVIAIPIFAQAFKP